MRDEYRVRIVKPDVPRSTLLPNEPLHAPNFRFRPLRSERHTPGKAMNEPITPALTPAEWAQRADRWPDHLIRGFASQLSTALGKPDETNRHALAALALHGQPFGFTQEDVDQLRRLATWQDVSDDGWKVDLDAASLADRIAALLPPRET